MGWPQEVQLLSGDNCVLIMTMEILHLQSQVMFEQDAAESIVSQSTSSVLG